MTDQIDDTHDPALKSWVEGADAHPDFPIQNLPLGIFTPADGEARGGVAIGDKVLDLRGLARSGLLEGQARAAAEAGGQERLNALLSQGPAPRKALRAALSRLLSAERGEPVALTPLLHDQDAVALGLPARIGGYTDFYAGMIHARTVGSMLRPENPLMPNYKHIPIGYHGRASSIRPSGTTVRRPNGQLKPADQDRPVHGPSRRLDYELELAIWIGQGNVLGEPIPIAEADDHIAGLSLLNDWSARDIQTWEYQPLGPFLGKNFATTISPWIVTREALAPFRIAPRPRAADDPPMLDYLRDARDQASGAYAIDLSVSIASGRMRQAGLEPVVVGKARADAIYWTLAQMVAHHASGGCNLEPGDMLGTGTISDEGAMGYGSLLEITRGGTQPLQLPSGEQRAFLEDDDEVLMRGRARADGFVSIGFGDCRAVITPAV